MLGGGGVASCKIVPIAWSDLFLADKEQPWSPVLISDGGSDGAWLARAARQAVFPPGGFDRGPAGSDPGRSWGGPVGNVLAKIDPAHATSHDCHPSAELHK